MTCLTPLTREKLMTNSSLYLTGDILTDTGWIQGRCHIENGQIAGLDGTPISENEGMSSDSPKYLPGFIDLHTHGCAGQDLMMGGESVAHIAKHQVQFGTTSFLATTMTAPLAQISQVLRDIQSYVETQAEHPHATVLGVHLEGPYINSNQLGAQPNFTRSAVLAEIQQLYEITPILVLTLAPECLSDPQLIHELSALNMRVQVGHSKGSYNDGVCALNNGASGFTHLFNAMSGLHHREPGIVGAALAHAEYAELIPDLIHVHPGAIRVALRAIPHLYCVTDSTSATGMPDGEYSLGSQTVHKCLGGVRLADGTLAGSTLTMIGALKNLHQIGLTVQEASHRLSGVPAQYLGLSQLGRIATGCVADILQVDNQLELNKVYLRGTEWEQQNA